MSSPHDRQRYARIFLPLALLSGGLVLLGFLVEPAETVLNGLRTILLSDAMLITDYMAIAGLGAALVNAGAVSLMSLAILYVSRDPANGFTIVTMSLMAGFALFGKNPLNILPIIAGTFLYAKLKQEHFSKYASISLLATSLAPVVSYLAFHSEKPLPLLAAVLGLLIGFVMPPLAAYTFRIQNGVNLYNAGFACGLLGLMLVPVLTALGHGPEPVLYWATEYDLPLSVGLLTFCLGLMAVGSARDGRGAWRAYTHLLRTSGRLPSDYLRTFGTGAVCINMGVNGLLAAGYILAVGGSLNGPTLGGILTVMGFSAYGKHARNIAPIILGVLLGNLVNAVPLDNPAMQLAGLFGTTLAPISGVFGWPFGILAGLLHSSVVLYSGSALEGMNLYHNGFSGGLTAIVLYPVLTALVYHRKPNLQDEDFYDIFEDDSPIPEDRLEAHKGEKEEEMPH